MAEQTQYLDENGEIQALNGEGQAFAYRMSAFQKKNAVILRTVFALTPGEPQVISARMQELAEKRRASQPLELPSAGSAFKRPVGGYAAALIEQAGLKGERVGDAQVSAKHAGFIVNVGNATASDVLALIQRVQDAVFAQSGVSLETEVRVIGEE